MYGSLVGSFEASLGANRFVCFFESLVLPFYSISHSSSRAGVVEKSSNKWKCENNKHPNGFSYVSVFIALDAVVNRKDEDRDYHQCNQCVYCVVHISAFANSVSTCNSVTHIVWRSVTHVIAMVIPSVYI